MTTLLYTHPACFTHNPGGLHPETPERLKAVLDALDAPVFDALLRREAPLAERADLLRVHTEDYIDSVFAAVPASGTAELDPETVLSAGSGEAALRAAGAVCAAVDAVVAGEGRNAFCAIRPPGHHAERDRAMGFCLFNNILVGALHARDVHGLKRVAIVDFDVHHGNGTQYSMEHDATVFYGSTHQARIFPATGLGKETGVGNVVNRVLPPGAGSEEFRTAFSEWIFPELGHFAPDMLFVSAGFDAHEGDPLADLRLTEADFAWVTQQLVSFAERYCGGRLVSALEGGYDPEALASSTTAHVMALMGV